MTTKKATPKPKAKQPSIDEVLGTTKTTPTTINNQNGYIGHLSEYVLLKVTDSSGQEIDLVFSHGELDLAAKRGTVNTQTGNAALIKDLIKA